MLCLCLINLLLWLILYPEAIFSLLCHYSMSALLADISWYVSLRTLTKTIHILFPDGLISLCLCENSLEGCDSSVFMDGVWNGFADWSNLFLLFLKRKKCWGSRQKLVEPLLNLRTAACQPTGLSNASRDVSHTLVLQSVFACMCQENFRKILLMCCLSLYGCIISCTGSHINAKSTVISKLIAYSFWRLMEKLA